MTTWAEATGIAGSWAAAALVVGLAVHIARLPNATSKHVVTAEEQLADEAESARERAEYALEDADTEFLKDDKPGAEDRIRVTRQIAIDLWGKYKQALDNAEDAEKQADDGSAYDGPGP